MLNNVFAIITAKNEEETIAFLVSYLCNLSYQVIVVDDGSMDRTGELALSNGAEVIRHNKSRGIAASLMEAWRMALDQGASYIVQLDAGGSHNPGEANHLVEHAIKDGLDMVIGSRFCPGATYNGRAWRAFLSRLVAWIMNFTAHACLTDWTSGYRVFSRVCLTELLQYKYYAKMHAWQMEVVARALLNKMKMGELPITYNAGRSSMNLKAANEALSVFLWRLFY